MVACKSAPPKVIAEAFTVGMGSSVVSCNGEGSKPTLGGLNALEKRGRWEEELMQARGRSEMGERDDRRWGCGDRGGPTVAGGEVWKAHRLWSAGWRVRSAIRSPCNTAELCTGKWGGLHAAIDGSVIRQGLAVFSYGSNSLRPTQGLSFQIQHVASRCGGVSRIVLYSEAVLILPWPL